MELYIFGASGLACEIATYILDLNYTINAFVDKNVKEKTIKIRGILYNVISEEEFDEQIKGYNNLMNICIAIGFPKLRGTVWEKYKNKCNIPNIIHPSVVMQDNVELGGGNVFAPNCVLTSNIKIGNANFFNLAITIGHDVSIGNFNVFNPQVAISGNVLIKEFNLFGANSSVIQKVSIGSDNVIGMGSVVLRKVQNNSTLIGIPAEKINL